jgi:D-cysteine desulfhydrase
MHPHEPARLALCRLPTPLVELKNLAAHLRGPRILLKRDDLTGLETTGNKVRKLEYVVADAIAQDADTLVTTGGFQSNHCRATAAIGAKLGLKVRLLLRSEKPNPSLDGNLLLDHLFGATITLHPPEEYNGKRQELIDTAMETERSAGRKPYFFPVGASIPLGCWGYVRCCEELMQQLGKETKVDVFSAVSSGGTHAGLMIGKALLGLDNWRMVGVPVSDSIDYFRKDLRRLVDETIRQFDLGLSEAQTPIDLVDGFIGEGYAKPHPAAVETIRLLGRTEGIMLDPTYTSKAMCGTLEMIRRGENAGGLRKDSTPVFIHTGGAFGLMARRDLLQ